ncbi:hydroxyacid-oxoacid transhydrogenase [Ureibacillus sp. NPDC094379]
MTRKTWEFFGSHQIVFGSGAVEQLPEILNKYHYQKVLVITDRGIASTPILPNVISSLDNGEFDVKIFDRAMPEPTLTAILDAYQQLKEVDDIDVIIGLGGGSSIDFAKIISLLIKYGGSPRDYYNGKKAVPGEVIPLIAIPTTAGTGSEVTTVAVINDEELKLKVGLTDIHLRPKIALLDSELTLGLPSYVTACSGIDALAHAIEAYTAKPFYAFNSDEKAVFQGAIPIAEPIALNAIEVIAENLEVAVHQGLNILARDKMLLGSLLAGMSFSNSGTALAHALAYPIGGRTKSPHGEIIGLLLPYVVKYNARMDVQKTSKLYDILVGGEKELTIDEKIEALYERLLALVDHIGIPTKLAMIGIKEYQIVEIIEETMHIDRLARNNPRTLTKQSLCQLLTDAL